MNTLQFEQRRFRILNRLCALQAVLLFAQWGLLIAMVVSQHRLPGLWNTGYWAINIAAFAYSASILNQRHSELEQLQKTQRCQP